MQARPFRTTARRTKRSFVLVSDWLRYSRVDVRLRGRRARSRLVVVVHVFYGELWADIASRLECLPKDTDVIVTIPDGAPVDPATLTAITNRATVVVRVPNRGRDVLPFSRITPSLWRMGYTRVLKLHTKRSLHTTEGHAWFQELLDGILPPSGVEHIIESLDDGTAVVGPGRHFRPLALVLAQQAGPLRRCLDRILGPTATDLLLAAPAGYGFFAGTMFWARLEAISDVQGLPVSWFAEERGQVNGTMAHAVERLYATLPQLRGQRVLVTSEAGLAEPSRADSLPTWATAADLAPVPGRPSRRRARSDQR